MKDDFVFPQDVKSELGATMQRAGGLTKRELFAAMIYSLSSRSSVQECIERTDRLLAELEKKP